MKLQLKTGSALGATFFIIGTCVGVNLLTIPLSTGIGGFIPALSMNILIGLIMLAATLLYAEVILAFPNGTNLLSATEQLLGPFMKMVAGFCMIYLFVAFSVSYFYVGGLLISDIAKSYLGWHIPLLLSISFITICLGILIYLGTWVSDRLNFILVVGLFISFFFMAFTAHKHIFNNFLLGSNWILILFSAPLLFLAYGFGVVIPTLITYVQRNRSKIFYSIVIGTSVPILLIAIWQILIIQSVPQGTIWEAYESPNSFSVRALLIEVPWLAKSAHFFIFFAFTTSILGTALGMIDFIADGFSLPLEERVAKKRLWIIILILAPTFVFATTKPLVFLYLLHYIGGFGVAILNGVIPLWLAWVLRYRNQTSSPLLRGGKPLLMTLLFSILFIIYLQGLQILKR